MRLTRAGHAASMRETKLRGILMCSLLAELQLSARYCVKQIEREIFSSKLYIFRKLVLRISPYTAVW
jgi:hypothetical protein